MLQNSVELLRQARAQGNYIPAFNVYNLETMQAALQASAQAERPVMLAFGASYLDNASLEVIVAMARTLAEGHPQPVVLHLDHCRDIGIIRAAIQAGFTSVMYDGSHLPLAENIANSRQVVEMAHAANVSVEGELGCLNAEDGTGEADGPYTDPAQARRYVTESGVDSLAVAVGNAHGLYKGTPHLEMELLGRLYDAAGLPLVLHGCSGIPLEQIRQAASIAVTKINVNTEVALAGGEQLRQMLQDGPVRLEKLMLAAREKMQQVMEHFY